MAQDTTHRNIIRRWLDKFTTRKPQEESTQWGNKVWLAAPYSDSYSQNNSLLSLLSDLSNKENGNLDYQILDLFGERQIMLLENINGSWVYSQVYLSIQKHISVINFLKDQRRGIFKNGQFSSNRVNYIAKYNYDDTYNEGNLEDSSNNENEIQNQREGILKSNNQTISSDFNEEQQYDDSKSVLNIISNRQNNIDKIRSAGFKTAEEIFKISDYISHINNQQLGVLKSRNSNLENFIALYNKDNNYEKNDSNLEKLEELNQGDTGENLRNKLYIRSQRKGILRSNNQTISSDFNNDDTYNESNLEKLEELNQGDTGENLRNKLYIQNQREGKLKSNNSTIISLFNNKKEYNIKNADYNNLPIILSGQVSGITIDELFSAADKLNYIIQQQDGILKSNNQTISSDFNNDDTYNEGNLEKLEELNPNDNPYDARETYKNKLYIRSQRKGILRSNNQTISSDFNNDDTYNEGNLEKLEELINQGDTGETYKNKLYIQNQRKGKLKNKVSLFSSDKIYNRSDAFYEYGSASADRIKEDELKRKINTIIEANQDGNGIGISLENNSLSFLQNFNKDYNYSLQTTQRAQTNEDGRTFLDESSNKVISNERGRITSLVDKWYRKRFKILSGRKWSGGNGVDHLVNNRTMSPNGTKNTDNVFSGTLFGPKDYELMFYETVSSWTSKPSPLDVIKMAEKGFNVGQIGGSTHFKTKEAFGGGSEILGSGFESLLNSIGYKDYNTSIENAKQKLVEMYVPGLNRTTQPYTIAAPLAAYLEQNLLLPTESPDVFKEVQDVFKELYLENRSAGPALRYANAANAARQYGTPIQDITVFESGVIAGTPLVEIERQGTLKENPRATPKVFKFLDDSTKLSYESKIQGFVNNIAGAVRSHPEGDSRDVGAELPAVITHNKRSYLEKLENRQQKGDEQYFPFLFETDNRTGGGGETHEQICYFQATIDSINETFNPAWQQKHFFGRTEQVSTYTYTDRALELSFSIIANTARQLQNLHERVSWLAQQTYGQYQFSGVQVNKLKSGPLIRVTIGDMFVGLGGYIQSLSYDWNFLGAGGKWEMTRGIRIPMACKVNMSFKVLHDDLPDRNYALYAGPLQRDDGLIRDDNGGPLIKTNNRSVYDTGPQQADEQYIDYLARNTSSGN